jgi:hypothetical protein
VLLLAEQIVRTVTAEKGILPIIFENGWQVVMAQFLLSYLSENFSQSVAFAKSFLVK